jgi:AmpE protein
MAASLLAVLIALGLLRARPQLAFLRHDGWFRAWTTQLRGIEGTGRTVLALLLPVLVCLLLIWLLGLLPLAGLWRLLFALLVLWWSLGPRELDDDLDALFQAPDGVSRQAAAQALADAGAAPAWDAGALAEATAYAALRRRFGVLFWFFLLGPVGALLYRLAQILGRDDKLSRDAASRADARYVANALDWLPAHLMVFTLAVVGHWEAVIGAWRAWHQAAGRSAWYGAEPGFLGAAARADIETDVQGGDGYTEESADPLVELARLRRALLRALVAWLGLAALIVAAAWLG